MKTVLVNGRFLRRRMTGVQRYAFEMLNAFPKIGNREWRFQVAVPGSWPEPTIAGHPVLADHSGFGGHLWEQVRLPSVFRRSRANLLWSPCNTGPWKVKRQILTIHDASVFAGPEWFSHSFGVTYRLIMRSLGRRVGMVVTDSEFSKSELERHGVCPSDRIRVVPCGVNIPSSIITAETGPGIPSSFVMTVGSRNPRKNVARLVEAWKRVPPQAKCGRSLLIVGGTERPFAREKLERLPQDVVFLDYVSDELLDTLYRQCDLFVFPSLYEGFGLPPLEAMVRGAPVLASDIPPLREVCGDAADYFDPYDVRRMALRLEETLRDASHRMALRSRGFSRGALFDWSRAADAFITVLEEVFRSGSIQSADRPPAASIKKGVFLSDGKGPDCPVCGNGKTSQTTFSPNVEGMAQCKGCGLEFAHPMKGGDAHWYDKAYVLRHAAVDTRVMDYFAWAAQFLPREGRVVDVGCGEGVFVHFIRARGFDAQGIDFSRDAVDIGRRWFQTDALHVGSLDLIRANPDLASVKCLTAFEVLEHTENPLGFVSDLHRTLPSGGWLALSVPNRGRWPVHDVLDVPPNHLTRWSPQALKRCLERAGFEVVRLEAGSRFDSYWKFLNYFPRALAYRLAGVRYARSEGGGESAQWTKVLRAPKIRQFLSVLRLRQVRSALTFPLAALTYPFVRRFFEGHNLMALARKP